MAYHIFTLRKLMLTNRMNQVNMKMMTVQFEREKVEDHLLSLWDQYYGVGVSEDDVDGQNLGEFRVDGNGSDPDAEPDEDGKNAIKLEIRKAQSEENKLDQFLKKLETQYTEAQNELKSVETQEAQALQASTPKYGGVAQQG